MYVSEQDIISGDVVAMLSTSPSFNEDTDHGRLVESVLQQQTSAKQLDRCGVFILIIDEKYPNPNATWRKRYAELRNEVRYKEFRFAIVTPSAIMRGALTAINWVKPPSPRFQTDAFAAFDEAARWAGGHDKIPILNRVREDVLAKLKQASPAARVARG